MDICWHSTLSRPHGYAMISRSLLLTLEKLGVRTSYCYLYGPGTVFPVPEEEDLGDGTVNAIKERKPERGSPHIIFGQGDAFEYVKSSVLDRKYRVGFTMLEVSGLPAEWVRQSNEMDEVWAPSPFNAWTFKKSGITRPVYIMPLGVDTGKFNPGVKGRPIDGVFTFLSIFEWGERKAPEVLLKAFNDTFAADEPVVLVCKYNNYDGAVDEVMDMGALGLDPNGGRIIFVRNRDLSYDQLPELYRSADCFVLPTRGEGWGMPILEAMACGLPVIATAWSAQTVFMNDSNSYPLQVSHLVDAIAKCPYYEGFKWAQPDTGHLKRLLRHVYENQEEARAKGEKAAVDAREKWSLELSAKRIYHRLGEIEGERSSSGKPSRATWVPAELSTPVIGFDISRGVGEYVTGVGRSSLNLLQGLAGLPPGENPFDFLLLPGIGDFVGEDYRQSYAFDNSFGERFNLYRGPLPAFGDPDHYVPGLSLVHSTAYTKPETEGLPLVVTVHDLTYLTHPEHHTTQNVKFCEENVGRAVESECHFITVSVNTKNDMVKYYNVDPDRISVVYNGIDPDEFYPAQERAELVRGKYSLPERFFFCVGSLEPRKNLEAVIRAIRIYNGPEPLVIVGFSGWKSSGLREEIERNKEKIKLIGYVPHEELAAFYNASLATLYPSLYEGFGLPVAESMACGTPVITSNTSSLPEVAGDACILLDDPGDPEALAVAMAEIAGNEAKRNELAERGLVQAAKFTLGNAARSTVDVYMRLLGTDTGGA